jgi:hypothetical protein
MVVLDDLHWADSGTLLLLRFLAGARDTFRVLVVATYRDTELDQAPALADALAALRRERGVEALPLTGLSAGELSDLMTMLAGHSLDAAATAFRDMLRRETGGNPFFAQEVLRHLAESGLLKPTARGGWTGAAELAQAVPDSVRDVLGRRVARLGPDPERVLGIAAVIGAEFDLTVLAAATGRDEDDLLDLLEQAERAALITSVSPERFAFRHSLVQQTLYAAQNPARRGRRHRAIAEALEARAGSASEARPADLARHWLEAVPAEPGRAVPYARRAGEEALAGLAPHEAAQWFARALEQLDRLPSAGEPDDGQMEVRIDLMTGLGEAQRRSGDPAHRATLAAAAELAGARADGPRMARAVLAQGRGMVSASLAVDRGRLDHLERALALLGDDPDNASLRARLLADTGVEIQFGGDFDRVLAAADEARAVARESGDPATLLSVLNLRYLTIFDGETLPDRLSSTAEAMVVAESVGDPMASFWATKVRVCACAEAGLVDEMDRLLVREEDLAVTIGEPFVRWVALHEQVWEALTRGNVSRCRQLAEDAHRLGSETGQPDDQWIYEGWLGQIWWHRGRMPQTLAAFRPEDIPPVTAAFFARAWVEADQPEVGQQMLERAAADGFNYDPSATRLSLLITWAEVAARLGARDVAETLQARLAPFPQQFAHNGLAPQGPLSYYQAELDGLLGDTDRAETRFADAVARCEAMRAPFHLARAQLGWGRLLATRGRPSDRQRARRLVSQAEATAKAYRYEMVERDVTRTLAGS